MSAPSDRLIERFRDCRAFVTGGSSGIGLATAEILVACGAQVAIAARRADQLDAARAALAARAGERKVIAIPLDIRDAAAVQRAASQVVAELGGVDLVINNAGVARPGRFLELSSEVFRDTMDTNYFGAVNVTRAFVPHLLERGTGHVSFVSSVLGFMGVFGYTAYGASKFALTGFAECLRQELAPRGIGVSVLFPPDTDTPQHQGEIPFLPAETKAISGNLKTVTAEHVARAYLEGIAAGRYEIASGWDVGFTWFMHRHFPGVVRWVMARDARKAARAG